MARTRTTISIEEKTKEIAEVIKSERPEIRSFSHLIETLIAEELVRTLKKAKAK